MPPKAKSTRATRYNLAQDIIYRFPTVLALLLGFLCGVIFLAMLLVLGEKDAYLDTAPSSVPNTPETSPTDCSSLMEQLSTCLDQ